jgi:serine/threonine-protein kinase
MARDRALRYPNAATFAEAIEEVLRRRRLQVGPGKLAAWIDRLGLAPSVHEEPESETGTRQTASLSIQPPSRMPTTPPARPSSLPGEMREVSPSIYRAKMPGGPTLGPFGYPRLVEMFVTGAIDHRVLLSRESSPFRDVASYTELGRFVNSPAFRWEEGVWSANHGVQPINRRELPRRMFQLAIKRETGALYFRDATRKKKIYVVEGVPELVVSTEKRELFGEHLVSRGAVLRMEIEMALAMLPRFNGHLGDALVGLGVLRPIELVRAIQSQMLDRTTEVFTWSKGEVAFVRGARSHEETFPFAIDPFDLVVRGVRDAYTQDELEAMLAEIEGDLIEPQTPLPVRLGAFHFTETEEQIITSVREPIAIADVAKAMRKVATREEVYRTIFCALSAGVLTSPKWTELLGAP